MAMQPSALPMGGAMMIPAGGQLGAGTVDFLASNPEQRLWDPLWHRKTITATTTGTVDYFDVATPAVLDGNVERGGTIPQPQLYVIYAFGIVADCRAAIADLKLLTDSFRLTLEINQRREFGPLLAVLLPAGGGIQTATTSGGTSGSPSPQFLHWMPIPNVIKGGEQFRVKMDVAIALTGMADTGVSVCMWGVRYRRAVSQ